MPEIEIRPKLSELKTELGAIKTIWSDAVGESPINRSGVEEAVNRLGAWISEFETVSKAAIAQREAPTAAETLAGEVLISANRCKELLQHIVVWQKPMERKVATYSGWGKIGTPEITELKTEYNALQAKFNEYEASATERAYGRRP